MMIRAVRTLACALLLAGAVALVRAQEIPNPFPPGERYVKTFANGLRLVVREDHSLPIVAMTVVVRGGAAVDPQGRGIAHILEHLVFQGTKNYPAPLAPQYALEEVGGISNAVTSRDMTRFQAAVGSAQVDLLVRVLAEITQSPTLAAERFDKERPVILAEIQREEDNPITSVLNRGYQLGYRTHPYRFSPSGTILDLLQLQAVDVRSYFKHWYVPNNMSVVLVGDITRARATALVEKAFGAEKSVTLPARPQPETTVPATAARAHFPRDLPDTYQVMVFPGPASRDFSATVTTDVLMSLLADGQDALLPACWAQEHVAVSSFGIEFVTARDPGRFLIWVQTAPNQAAKARNTTLRLLQQLSAGQVPPAPLQLAKQRVASEFLLENETYSQQAATIAFYEGLGEGTRLSQYVPTAQAVTLEQLRAAVPTRLAAWVTLGARVEGE